MKKRIVWMVLLLQRGMFLFATSTTDNSTNLSTDKGMPWNTPLGKIQDALEGPTLKIISIILIVTAGIFIATSEGSGVKKKGAWIIIGLAVAANASKVFTTLFSDGAGTLLW